MYLEIINFIHVKVSRVEHVGHHYDVVAALLLRLDLVKTIEASDDSVRIHIDVLQCVRKQLQRQKKIKIMYVIVRRQDVHQLGALLLVDRLHHEAAIVRVKEHAGTLARAPNARHPRVPGKRIEIVGRVEAELLADARKY